MFDIMVLVVACIALGSIIGIYDVVTKRGKRTTVRLLVASFSTLFVLCLMGSYRDGSLPGSCEVLSSTKLSSEKTRYQFRSLSDGKMFTRTFKQKNFPPSGFDLVSLEERKLLIKKN